MTESPTGPPSDAGITITRVFDAPRERVWKEWTEPEPFLTDLGDGRTEMHFQQRGSLPAETYERAKEGWSTFFDRIAERLAA